jgi:hypothetical protein
MSTRTPVQSLANARLKIAALLEAYMPAAGVPAGAATIAEFEAAVREDERAAKKPEEKKAAPVAPVAPAAPVADAPPASDALLAASGITRGEVETTHIGDAPPPPPAPSEPTTGKKKNKAK